MRRALPIAATLLAVGGCTVYPPLYWARPGATPADFAADSARCDDAAATRYPPVALGVPEYFPSPDTWCTPTSGGPNCAVINPGYLPQARSENDTNAARRETAYRACMMAGGWRPFDPGSVPPESPMPDAAVDRALTYCELRFNGRPNTGPLAARFNQCVTARARELSGPRPPA